MVRYLRVSRPRCRTAKDHANRSGPQAFNQADDVGAIRFRSSRRWRPIKVMSGECLAAWRGRLLVARYCGLRTNVRIAPRYGLSLRETTEVQMIAMLQHRQHFYSVATVCNRSIEATQDTGSPAAVGHLPVGVWVAANRMDFKVEPIRISAMSLGVFGSTHPVRCGARPRRAHRGEPGRETVVGL